MIRNFVVVRSNGAESAAPVCTDVVDAVPGPAPEAIRSLEAYCRNPLPEDFKAFLANGNGARPKRARFLAGGRERRIERFLAVMDDPASDPAAGQYDIGVVEAQIGERLAVDPDQYGCVLIPFAALFAGDFLCFDFRGDPGNPGVVVWDHEQSDDFSPVTVPVAGSFTELLSGLYA